MGQGASPKECHGRLPARRHRLCLGRADGLSPVLQIRRMLRARSSREVSLGYFSILLAGFLLWISYGIAAGNMWLVVPNSIALLVGLTLVAVALRLRRS